MKKRFGMWIVILGILVVGIAVTRTTNEFITANGYDNSVLFAVVNDGFFPTANTSDAGTPPPAEVGAGNASASIKDIVTNRNTTAAAAQEAEAVVTAEPGEVPMEAAETLSETQAVAEVLLEDADEASPIGPSVSPEDAEAYGRGSHVTIEIVEEEQKAEAAPASAFAESAEGAPAEAALEEKSRSSVTSGPGSMAEAAEELRTTAYFIERFQEAEAKERKFWENVDSSNLGARNTAAEQSRAIWDNERTLILEEICSLMPEGKAEAILSQELEWNRERDRYAEKASAKSGKTVEQKQNPDYTGAQADKTKERCYWLVAEYENLLNRE